MAAWPPAGQSGLALRLTLAGVELVVVAVLSISSRKRGGCIDQKGAPSFGDEAVGLLVGQLLPFCSGISCIWRTTPQAKAADRVPPPGSERMTKMASLGR